MTLELAATLPFPVVGAREDAIRSLFGASRDDGRRHQGVDIFVQRLTPVLAVAAGQAMPGKDALGGNTVWLNTPGTSYYYAHLDRIAVRDQQRVKAGDVLGYVGNTGNARNVASHLHFGVYRWGRTADRSVAVAGRPTFHGRLSGDARRRRRRLIGVALQRAVTQARTGVAGPMDLLLALALRPLLLFHLVEKAVDVELDVVDQHGRIVPCG